MPDLYFFETTAQAESFFGYQGSRTKEGIFVSAYPSATWYFERTGIGYNDIENFEVRRPKDEVEGLLRAQVEWAFRLDGYLASVFPDLPAGFRPTGQYLHFIKNCWDSVLHHSALAEHVIRELGPDRVFWFHDPVGIRIKADLEFSGSLYDHVIPQVCGSCGIPCEPLAGSLRVPPLAGAGRAYALLRRDLPRSAYRVFRTVSAHLRDMRRERSRRGALVFQGGYEFTPAVISLLREKGYRILAMDRVPREMEGSGLPPFTGTAMRKLVTDLSREPWFLPENPWAATGTGPLLPFFEHYLVHVVPHLWTNFGTAGAFLQKHDVRALGFCVWEPGDTGILLAAKAAGIPRILYQHGASVGDVENLGIIYNDHLLSDFELVYGKGEADYINSHVWYPDHRTTACVVGDARIESLMASIDPAAVRATRKSISGCGGTPVVLYVPGPLMTDFYRYNYHDFRNNRVFATRRRIFEIASAAPEISFCYKPMVSQYDDPTAGLLAGEFPKIRIITDIRLPVLQCAADLIIQEVPSTGMYEAMIYDTAMIVLADREVWHMPDEVRDLLGRRVHLAADTGEFIAMAGESMAHIRDWAAPNGDKGFWRHFCVPEDGRSASRAAETIDRIARMRAEGRS
ncbi:MAG: hypothetical protein ABR999_03855 [Methanoregula sp.]|jgi:hypothetical protein|uniref:hypothetical protein n=1 Tax=Methanoregula sp. TaxID=2052170 RepID=UPI003D0D7C1E